MNRQELRAALDGFWCKCGEPEEAAAALYKLLGLFPLHSNNGVLKLQDWLGGDSGMFYLLLGLIEDKGLIEHGGSISGSWLTLLGEQIRDALAREEADEFEKVCEPCCIHGFSIDNEMEKHKCGV